MKILELKDENLTGKEIKYTYYGIFRPLGRQGSNYPPFARHWAGRMDKMKALAVLRVAKIKALGQLGAANSHNARRHDKPHIDNSNPMMGGGVRLLQGRDDPIQAFKDRIAQTGAKPRKGAVLALEFVASASPEWFQAASQKDRALWMEQTLIFLNETVGGPENVLAAHLHDDETTPHIHFVAVPLVQKQRRQAGRKAKTIAAQDKQNEGLSWALSAADIVGDKRKLETLQSNYALAVSELGIRRGKPKSVTQAKHKSPSAYRAEIAANTKKHEIASARQARQTNEAINFGLTVGFDAVDKGEIAFAPATDEAPEQIVRGPNAPKGNRWSQIMYAIHPVATAILQYAKARSRLLTKERALKIREREVVEEASELISMAGRLIFHRRSLGPAAVGDAERIKQRALRTRDRSR